MTPCSWETRVKWGEVAPCECLGKWQGANRRVVQVEAVVVRLPGRTRKKSENLAQAKLSVFQEETVFL